MPGPVFVEGDGVDLRTRPQADVGLLQKAASHRDVRRYAGGDVDAEPIDGVVDLLVCDGETPVDAVSLAPVNERRGWANLGYWIHPDHWGEGYATEAARPVVTHGFEALWFHRISATIHASNDATRRVVEKPGFVHEGTKRDDDFVDSVAS